MIAFLKVTCLPDRQGRPKSEVRSIYCQLLTSVFRLLTFFLLTFHSSFSQVHHIKGNIRETFSGTPIPFAVIKINNEQHAFSDIEGSFSISFSRNIDSLTFTHHLHRSVTIYPSEDSSYFEIRLNKYEFFIRETRKDSAGEAIIKKVFQNRNDNDPRRSNCHSYTTYNKLTFSTRQIEKTDHLLRKAFGSMAIRFKSFRKDQHLLMLESVTEMNYYNRLRFKEVITGAKSSGINLPSLFVQTTQVQAFSVYSDHFPIAGKQYLSPLVRSMFTRYYFKLIEMAITDEDTTYVLKYNPSSKRRDDAIKGLLYISSKNYGVKYLIAWPSRENSIEMNVLQSYRFSSDTAWFPDRSKTIVAFKRQGEKFIIEANTFVSDLNPDVCLPRNAFDEAILEYSPDAHKKGDEFWLHKRKVALTPADSATYMYYDSTYRQKILERILRIGEHIFYGNLPVGKVNIDLHRLITFNAVEKVRLGIGMHTSNRFSRRLILGGYYGYGLEDRLSKYGAHFTYRILPEDRFFYHISYAHDLREAGDTEFPFDRYQYSSESLRRFRLRILDRTEEVENSLNFRLLKYLSLRLALRVSRQSPAYEYTYKGIYREHFDYTEIKTGFRYAFGENFIRLPDQKYSIGSRFPILYFQHTRGLNDFLNGAFSYHRFDLKIEQNIKIAFVGTTGIQLVGGIAQGQTPYSVLYNGRGSLQQPSIVIHNSFETMAYNEFLSDRHAAIFLSHNFGKIYLLPFNPSLWIMHNSGFGTLTSPEDHMFPFRTMEKGFHESGMFLNNIITVNLAGLKTGIGAGLFMRYGPYRHEETRDNLVFKFSTHFVL